jgi:hypothetical protein
MRVSSVDFPVLFPREGLLQVAIWIAPIAFGLCTVATNAVYRRHFNRIDRVEKIK